MKPQMNSNTRKLHDPCGSVGGNGRRGTSLGYDKAPYLLPFENRQPHASTA